MIRVDFIDMELIRCKECGGEKGVLVSMIGRKNL